MIDFKTIIDSSDADSVSKSMTQKAVDLCLRTADINDKIKLIKNYILTQAVIGDNACGISVSAKKFPELFKEFLAKKAEYANKLFIVNMYGNLLSIPELSDMCASNEVSFSQKIDGSAVVRVSKNLLYFSDVKTLMVLIASGETIGLFTKSGIDQRNANDLVSDFSPLASLDAEGIEKIVSLSEIVKLELDILKKVESDFKDSLGKFYAKSVIPVKQAVVKKIQEELSSLLRQYNDLLEKEKQANVDLFLAKHGDSDFAEDITKLWAYIDRLKSTGILERISSFEKGRDRYSFTVEYAPAPIYYCDTAILKKVYKNCTTNETRRSMIEKVIAGEAFFMAAPTKIKFTLNCGSSCGIDHYIIEGPSELENPHYRYNSRRGCLGTFQTSLSEANTRGDFAAYLGLMTQYTQSLTPADGAGDAGIRRLPIVDTSGNIILNHKDEIVNIPARDFWKGEF